MFLMQRKEVNGQQYSGKLPPNKAVVLGPDAVSQDQPNNRLHGLTLEKMLVRLQEHYGWEGLDKEIQINCFYNNPSIKSSLKFLRRTQWARDKVEALYIDSFCR